MLYNFIICEDSEIFIKKYISIINKVKKETNIEIMIYTFDGYCEGLKQLIYSNLENKIYILDLMMLDFKGNDIAKVIRNIDFVSLIIFITSYYKDFSMDIITGEYAYLKYIDKYKDYENELFKVLINTIIKFQDLKTLKIEIKDKIYNLVPKDITCIYTEGRKIVAKNIYEHTITIPMTLNTIQSMLPDYFEFSKNCCLVNTNRIVEIDKNNRVIYFDNYTYINLVSRKYLKSIIEKLKKDLENI